MISVFLSSTFRDFDDYRKEVGEALEMAGWIRSMRLEEAAGPYDDTIEACKGEFSLSDAFMLLLAHWYGSIPVAASKSITHMEFEWAWQRWKDQKRRPMAVLMPAHGSPADFELRERAENLLTSADPDYQKEHPRRLADFRQQVTSWQRVMYFPTRERAARLAIVAYFRWQDRTPMRAALDRRVPGGDDSLLSEASLGGLGRHVQVTAFRSDIARLKLNPSAPGAAFLIVGDEGSGHLEFLAHLIHCGAVPGRPARTALLPAPGFPADELPVWASEQFGFAGAERAGTIADLARKLAEELQRQSLSMVLGSLEHLSGGVPAFHQQFWNPLFHALAELRARRPFRHRVLAIVAEYEPAQEAWGGSVFERNSGAVPPTYDRLLLLPELKGITADDAAQWLEENRVQEEQRRLVVLEVMKGKVMVPARVAFERLKRQNLQCEAGEID